MTTHTVTVRSAYITGTNASAHEKFNWRVGDIESPAPTTTPFFTAARYLLDNGLAQPGDNIEMMHEGDSYVSLRSLVGKAAKLQVSERDSGKTPPTIVPYVPFPTDKMR